MHSCVNPTSPGNTIVNKHILLKDPGQKRKRFQEKIRVHKDLVQNQDQR